MMQYISLLISLLFVLSSGRHLRQGCTVAGDEQDGPSLTLSEEFVNQAALASHLSFIASEDEINARKKAKKYR